MVETLLPCECGFVARADDEETLVAEVLRHAREAHGMALSRDEALALASRAPVALRPRTDEEET